MKNVLYYSPHFGLGVEGKKELPIDNNVIITFPTQYDFRKLTGKHTGRYPNISNFTFINTDTTNGDVQKERLLYSGVVIDINNDAIRDTQSTFTLIVRKDDVENKTASQILADHYDTIIDKYSCRLWVAPHLVIFNIGIAFKNNKNNDVLRVQYASHYSENTTLTKWREIDYFYGPFGEDPDTKIFPIAGATLKRAPLNAERIVALYDTPVYIPADYEYSDHEPISWVASVLEFNPKTKKI